MSQKIEPVHQSSSNRLQNAEKKCPDFDLKQINNGRFEANCTQSQTKKFENFNNEILLSTSRLMSSSENENDEEDENDDDDDEDDEYEDVDNDDENDADNEEFRLILSRFKSNYENRSNLNNLSTTLKYLFRLLKIYKLEHYMNELIDSGYYTPVSLYKLKQNDLDKFNVSPYDKKKFLKLQLFIKQVMSTISSNGGNKVDINNYHQNLNSNADSKQHSSSSSAPVWDEAKPANTNSILFKERRNSQQTESNSKMKRVAKSTSQGGLINTNQSNLKRILLVNTRARSTDPPINSPRRVSLPTQTTQTPSVISKPTNSFGLSNFRS